jgi:hypothetical protein
MGKAYMGAGGGVSQNFGVNPECHFFAYNVIFLFASCLVRSGYCGQIAFVKNKDQAIWEGHEI